MRKLTFIALLFAAGITVQSCSKSACGSKSEKAKKYKKLKSNPNFKM